MSNIIDEIESQFRRAEPLPSFQVGDTVDVHVLIKEGEKERIQIFNGTVIKIQGGKGLAATFTVRRIVASEGVERTFPIHSRVVRDVQVTRKGRVRRARLFYLRDRIGKATRVKERRDDHTRPPKKSRKARAAARAAATEKSAKEKAGASGGPGDSAAESSETSEAAAGVS